MWPVSPCCPDFVSICNVWRLFGPVTVTDRDECLGAAGLSKSVTFRGLENVLLLQIEMFGAWLGECLNL